MYIQGNTIKLYMYLIHVELAHIKIGITSDRNEVWAQDVYYSTALIEAA